MEIYKSAAGKQAVEAVYRRALERWPVPRRERTIPTSEGSTFVVECGPQNSHAALKGCATTQSVLQGFSPTDPALNGCATAAVVAQGFRPADSAPLVLFHGSGANSSVWMRDVAVWARDRRVYAVDLIGEPGFSAPSRPPLASDAYARWLDDVWDGLGIAVASVIGVSLGGWLALDYAARRPQRVLSLSLLSPSGIGSQRRLFMIKALALMMLGPWGVRRSFDAVAGSSVAPEARTFVATVFRNFRPRMERVPRLDDDALASLTMPVQVIVGGKDVLLRSDETRDRVQRRLPHAQLTFLAGARHILPSQAPRVAEFLASVDAKIGQSVVQGSSLAPCSSR